MAAIYQKIGCMDHKCSGRSVMVKNTGKRNLSNIRIKIQSKDEIKYKKNELVNIPHKFNKCKKYKTTSYTKKNNFLQFFGKICLFLGK